jgi:hypothetical protein
MLNDLFEKEDTYMKPTIILGVLLTVAMCLLVQSVSFAQTDREVRAKQTELKKEYNQAQEKNQLIKTAAVDKPKTTGRRRTGGTTGYDYSQVKGYALGMRNFEERIDKLFARASELGFFEDPYHANGSFPAPGRKGQGSSTLAKIEVYYVEATPEEIETQNVEPFDMIEVRIQKNETLPPAEATEEGGDEGSGDLGMMGAGGYETVPKFYTLSGQDLWTIIRIVDESLYEDILSRRSQESPIALPSDLFLPEKRGPFIVMSQRDLETSTSRFFDFWNKKDTMTTVEVPRPVESSGPLTKVGIPILYPDISKVRVQNPNKDQLKISEASFVGDNASQFIVRTKLPLMLDPKGGQNEKSDITFEYIGSSPYEVRTQLQIEAREAKMSQTVDIIANPGRHPSDFAVLDASLDKLELRSPSRSSFAPDWRLTYEVGNREICLPRWSSGMSTLSVGFKHEMSVGVVLPMNLSAPDLPSPLAYQSRLFSSPTGYNVSFDFTFGFPFSLGGSLTVADKFTGKEAYQNLIVVKEHETNPNRTDYYNDFFHIGSSIQLYYPIMFKDRSDDPNIAFRIDIGGGYMQIQRDHLVEQGELVKAGVHFGPTDAGNMFTLEKQKDIVDVYMRLSFINLSARNNYGIGLQYFAGRMMADAWLELTNWLRVETSYSFLLRDREVWENESTYFFVTPRFRFGFPSIFN